MHQQSLPMSLTTLKQIKKKNDLSDRICFMSRCGFSLYIVNSVLIPMQNIVFLY